MIGSVTAKAAWVGRTASMVFGLALVMALVIGALVGYDSASAQSTAAFPGSVIKVTTKVDESNTDGDCSLREAIEAANTNTTVDGCKAGSATEQDAIHFAVGKKAKTIVLGSQLPAITDPSGLRITGREASITISGNEQVRVFEVAAGAQLALLHLTVADGTGGFSGGGLLNSGTVKVANTTFSNNSASFGGGILNDGTLEVTKSTLSNNSAGVNGAGIYNQSGSTLEVTNSTFSENSATQDGGGIFNNVASTLEVTNSTFSENSVGNTARGIFNNGGTATLRNTILSNSTSGGNLCTGTPPIADGGYNIDTDGTCVEESVTTSQTTDPRLDPDGLQDNGGPTKTIALLEGSPAINAIPQGENGCGTDIKTDQRGVSRPQGSGCDIGAYEKEGTQ
jgi:CSLREA domain-containing protein